MLAKKKINVKAMNILSGRKLKKKKHDWNTLHKNEKPE